jgi:hypothetical protein
MRVAGANGAPNGRWAAAAAAAARDKAERDGKHSLTYLLRQTDRQRDGGGAALYFSSLCTSLLLCMLMSLWTGGAREGSGGGT